MTDDASDPRYPTGPFRIPDSPIPGPERTAMIDRIADTPAALRAAVAGLTDAQLDTPYRRDGWTVRQVVHHLVDSHVNSYCRFKLTITEDHPTIRTYREDRWGEEPDAREADVDVSLRLLDALHERWTGWLRTLSEGQWARTFHHPEMGDLVLDQLLALYAWHGPHHVAHITGLREREGW